MPSFTAEDQFATAAGKVPRGLKHFLLPARDLPSRRAHGKQKRDWSSEPAVVAAAFLPHKKSRHPGEPPSSRAASPARTPTPPARTPTSPASEEEKPQVSPPSAVDNTAAVYQSQECSAAVASESDALQGAPGAGASDGGKEEAAMSATPAQEAAEQGKGDGGQPKVISPCSAPRDHKLRTGRRPRNYDTQDARVAWSQSHVKFPLVQLLSMGYNRRALRIAIGCVRLLSVCLCRSVVLTIERRAQRGVCAQCKVRDVSCIAPSSWCVVQCPS